MKYMASSAPLSFKDPVICLGIINAKTKEDIKIMMDKINGQIIH